MRKLADLERERTQHAVSDGTDLAPELAVKNYITPKGYARLKSELVTLLNGERPELVKVIAWAAANGDRSENADYIYGKRRLREIDRRIRHLTQRLDRAVIIDPARPGLDQVFFGATVTYRNLKGQVCTITIVGQDEVDTQRGRVSWIAPVARALNQKRIGAVARVETPAGGDELEILAIRYVDLGD